MSMIGTKTPDEVKDYSLDWSKDLGTDTVANTSYSVWTVSPSDVNVTQSSIATNGTVATVWLSGGTAGQVYHVKNTITTVAGRGLTKVFRLLVVNNNFL
jgi:hypothetical protein